MPSSTVILYASGRSRSKIDEMLAAYPDAQVWTLNSRRHPRATLHFDIHAPRPQTKPDPAVPAIVSPFASIVQANEWRFPLAEVLDLGAKPFFELSHDYMLAFAALLRRGCNSSDFAGFPLARRQDIRRIIFCGVDCDDRHHFDQSRGVHLWSGWLLAEGVDLVTFASASMFIRRVHPGHLVASPGAPHFYGQPGEVAEGWLKRREVAIAREAQRP